MNVIFLRGAVPPEHEHPEKLFYDTIENCEDVWTQFFWYLLDQLGATGELVYVNGDREFQVNEKLTERWVPSLDVWRPDFKPDMIFCRGGFAYYDSFVKSYPEVVKIYYGAGARYYPQTDFTDYDLFLCDSRRQLKDIREKGKNAELFIKPAASLFRPFDVEKKYDVCFMANGTQAAIKRHEFLFRKLSGTGLSILNLGNYTDKITELATNFGTDVKFGGWHLRKDLPKLISLCKVGVCCSTNYDSCPRVIPEYLACGLPVIATSNINFWKDKYITKDTGMIVKDDDLVDGIQYCLGKEFNTRDYYDEYLSLTNAAVYLCKLLRGIL